MRWKYSIIIPVYNAFEYLEKCIISIRKYSLNYKIILVDNGSNSETQIGIKKLCNQLDDIILITNEKNLGFAKAINKGFQMCQSEYVCIANSDIEVCENWLNIFENFFSRLNGFLGFCGQDVNSKIIGVKGSKKYIDNEIIEVDYLGMSCLFSSKLNFDLVGLLDEGFDLGYCEDTDYGIRIMQKGLKSYIIPINITHHIGKTARLLNQTELGRIQGKNVERFFKKWSKWLEGREK